MTAASKPTFLLLAWQAPVLAARSEVVCLESQLLRDNVQILRQRPSRCAFHEPPRHHGDHLRERPQRGLAWVLEKPLKDVR